MEIKNSYLIILLVCIIGLGASMVLFIQKPITSLKATATQQKPQFTQEVQVNGFELESDSPYSSSPLNTGTDEELITDPVTEFSKKPISELSNTALNTNTPSSLVSEINQSAVEETVIEPVIEKILTFQEHLAIQAELRLQSDVTYDGSYHSIAYPMGDVPENIGVCTDVVIRSYRALGIDLQQRVHEDMKSNFRSYPQKWQLKRPDTNIDHRRVPNLMTYFERAGGALEITKDPFDYKAGNVVSWDLGKGLVHIGIVSNYVSETTGNPLIVHNIGAGPEMNDILFKYKIIGHYRYASLDSLGVREVVEQLP